MYSLGKYSVTVFLVVMRHKYINVYFNSKSSLCLDMHHNKYSVFTLWNNSLAWHQTALFFDTASFYFFILYHGIEICQYIPRLKWLFDQASVLIAGWLETVFVHITSKIFSSKYKHGICVVYPWWFACVDNQGTWICASMQLHRCTAFNWMCNLSMPADVGRKMKASPFDLSPWWWMVGWTYLLSFILQRQIFINIFSAKKVEVLID